MKKYSVAYLPLIIGAALAAGLWLGGVLDFGGVGPQLAGSNASKQKINRLIDYIDNHYVDEVNTDSIVDVTVSSIMKNLDPHSVYIPQSEVERMADDMRGNFVGIGVSFFRENDTMQVIKALEGGPSRVAGIRGGDKILEANGYRLYGSDIDNDSIGRILRGKAGTAVDLLVKRRNQEEPIAVSIVRGEVPISSIAGSYMIEDGVGYIKVNRFAGTTYDDFDEALDKLVAQGMDNLILDLRDNPGGYLDAATEMVDEFLADDKLIVYTRDKKGKEDRSYATDDGDFKRGQVYVLLNENSASASEVVAGALQDNDRGIIVGRRSYGKGLVQREMKLGDGSAVRLTTSRYYTPTGRSIQRPYNLGDDESYEQDYLDRYENGELRDAANIEVDDSLKFTTPGGRVVYGGGGITPDLFVPLDDKYENQTINFIRRSGFAERFVYQLVEDENFDFGAMDFQTFQDSYEVSTEMVSRFTTYCRAAGLDISFAAYMDEIKTILKSAVADQLFNQNKALEIMNRDDLMINRVLDEIRESRAGRA